MPEEERLKILRDVAENGGKKSFEDKKGIHGRSSEQHINDGKNSALSRGFVPYFYELKET